MTKAIIYARCSPRPKAAMERNESIELQLERCEAYCKANDYVVIARYSDDEASGTHTERPGLFQAISDACTNKAVLVVYSLSRFARNTKDAIELMETLKAEGACLASLHEKIDTSGAMGKFLFVLMAAIAELERNQISERTSDAMRYGRTPEEDLNIECMREMIQDGVSYNQMARCMNESGSTCRGRPWNAKTIWRILQREEGN